MSLRRFICILFIMACSAETKRKSACIEELGTSVILPTYTRFETSSARLHTLVNESCSVGIDSENWRALQLAWSESRGHWKQMELLRFGPYNDEPLRLGPKIDFWPVRTETVDEKLAGTITLDIESFSAMGASSRGLPVLEYVLFSPTSVEEMNSNPRRCLYLVGASGDLAFNATRMREAWDPAGGNYLETLSRAGKVESTYPSVDAALAELVNRLSHTLQAIRLDKLLTPLGESATGPQPDRLESRFSHRSIQDIRDNLLGIERVYFGVTEMGGLNQLLPDSFDAPVRGHLDTLEQILLGLEQQGTLADALLVEPETIEYLVDALREFQRLLYTDIIEALSLWQTFYDGDGD